MQARRILLLAAGLALLVSTGGCGLFGDDGPATIAAIGALHRDPDRAAPPLSLPDRLLLDATAQGLVAFNAEGQVEAGLAERWTVIDGGRSYIFRLRDARWLTGPQQRQRVRAGEVARLLQQRMRSARLRPALQGEFAAVESVRAITDKVIEIRLRRAEPHLFDLLAQPDLAIVNRGAGWGPWQVEWDGGTANLSEVPLMEMVADGAEADQAGLRSARLLGTDGLGAVTRFDAGDVAAVLGGRFEAWPYLAAAGVPGNAIAIDPAEGLFGLAVMRADGLLSTAEGRSALAMAIDRAAIGAALDAKAWAPRLTIRQNGGANPAAAGLTTVYPDWVDLSRAERLALARERVAAWRAANGVAPPVVRIALPQGPGARMLFARLSSDLAAIGVTARLVRLASDADLRLIDDVAPSSDPGWYLRRLDRTHLPLVSRATQALIAAIADAPVEQRAAAIEAAERAMQAEALFFPLAAPLRWSLISGRVQGFRPNARARHSLNSLQPSPN